MFRKIDVRIWNDAKFRGLPLETKALFLLLLTHPHQTQLGAFRSSCETFAKDLQILPGRIRKAFGKLSKSEMAHIDEDAGLVWVVNFLKYNPPASPNCVKSIVSIVDQLPECALLDSVVKELQNLLGSFSEPYRKPLQNLTRRFAKPSPNQEQEQEMEQEQEQENTCPDPAGQESGPAPPELACLPLYAMDENLCKRWPELYPTWRQAYPGVDVLAEVKAAHAWEVANPDRRKTNRPKYLTNWLKRAQDRGHGRGGYQHPDGPVVEDLR